VRRRRRLAEEALQRSEGRYRALYEDNPSMYFTTDAEGTVLSVNRFGAEQLGYSTQELVGQPVLTVFHPDDRETVRQQLRICLQKPMQTAQWEFRKVRKDGSVLWVKETARAVTGPDGNPVILVVCEDITKRKQTDEALRNSERRLSDIINFLPDATFVINREGKVIAWNRAMEAMTGVKESDILGKGNYEYAMFFYGERRPMLIDLILEPDETMERCYSQFQRRDFVIVAEAYLSRLKGGAYVWGKATLLYDSDGNIIGAIESIRDISGRILAQEALRAEKEKYRVVVETSPLGIAIIGEDGRYKYINPKFIELFRYTLEDIPTGREWFAQAYPDAAYRKEAISAWLTDLKQSQPGEVRPRMFTVTCKDGSKKTIQFRSVASRTAERLVIYEDVSERERAEANLRIYQEQLRSLASELSMTEERERRRLATDLHDSIGQTLAISKFKLDALRSQETSAVRAHELDDICNLLDGAIQDTRSLIFELSPPDLYELGIEAALASLVKRMKQAYTIEITLSDRGRPKPLSEDTAVFCLRAVQELLVNVVRHARARKVEVSSGREGDCICITVEDDGIGFDTGEALSRPGGKKGFGLFSIRERLQHLGGSLKIDSNPGEGTLVTLLAPLEDNQIGRC
jgi:PAS domain S-box-containing protein